MVPAKLTLRNFMCYRGDVEPLDFSGIHVASLSGENGAGKSTLLDAITWALWGQSRARTDDDLIHIGQREMEVEYEFCHHCTTLFNKWLGERGAQPTAPASRRTEPPAQKGDTR